MTFTIQWLHISVIMWICEKKYTQLFFPCKLNNFFSNYSCHLQVYFAHFMLNQTAISIWRNFVLFSICFAYYHSSIFGISRETLQAIMRFGDCHAKHSNIYSSYLHCIGIYWLSQIYTLDFHVCFFFSFLLSGLTQYHGNFDKRYVFEKKIATTAKF